jgi:hypothetical protein
MRDANAPTEYLYWPVSRVSPWAATVETDEPSLIGHFEGYGALPCAVILIGNWRRVLRAIWRNRNSPDAGPPGCVGQTVDERLPAKCPVIRE